MEAFYSYRCGWILFHSTMEPTILQELSKLPLAALVVVPAVVAVVPRKAAILDC